MKTDEQKECGLLAEVTEPTSYVVTGERKAKSCHVANKVTYEQLRYSYQIYLVISLVLLESML